MLLLRRRVSPVAARCALAGGRACFSGRTALLTVADGRPTALRCRRQNPVAAMCLPQESRFSTASVGSSSSSSSSSDSESSGGTGSSGAIAHEGPTRPWQELMDLLYKSEQQTGKLLFPPASVISPEAHAERRAALEAELSAVGLQLRRNSMLCRDFVAGRLSADVTVVDIAQVMAGMRYLNEYCGDFAKALDVVEDRIEACIEVLRRRNDRKYYAGIHADACELVYGHGARHYNDIRRHLYTTWTDFPERCASACRGHASPCPVRLRSAEPRGGAPCAHSRVLLHRWPWLDEPDFGYDANGKSLHKNLADKFGRAKSRKKPERRSRGGEVSAD